MTTKLTLDEIGVLREVARWRRNREHVYVAGHGLTPMYRLFRDGAPAGAIAWLGPKSQANCMKIGVTPDYSRKLFTWYTVTSIEQALDLLVTLGYLPKRFASAYRAGWNAARLWCGPEGSDPTAFRQAFHDPSNISFPAWEAVW